MASPPNDNNNKAVLLAEELRQKGNKAYLSKDFKQALEWYQKSNAQKEDARCYSNVAEVYLKLGDYASAREAAERATTLKPDWAKPWWRKGRIAELFKDFESAINYYEIAVKQEPKNKEYRKALRNCEKRMKIIEKIPEGHYVVEPPTSSSDMEGQSPAMKAWKRVGKRFGGHMACWNSKYDAAKKTPEISSEEWLFKGLNIWVAGMKGSIAYLGLRMSPEARTAYLQMNGGLGPTNMAFQEDKLLAMEEMFGGIITGNELFCLADGIAHFGAKGLFLETGGRPNKDEYCAPPPKCLEHHLPYQSLAVAMTIDMELQGLLMTFGPNMKCSNGVLSGSLSLYSNLKAQCTLNIADLEQQPSPQEIVNYVKEQLEGGIHTWDNGIRSYISLQYRGTILFACVLILIGQCSQAYKLLKWAIEFIDLADEEFHVTEEESYEDKGSAFKPTQRVGMLMALFEVQSVLRGNSLNGAYSISESIHIALAISEMAERTKLKEDSPGATAVEDYAFYVRKPLAKAHSSIAAILNLIHNQCDLMNFKQVAVHHDFIEDTDSFVDPRALVAQHYHIAAQNELFDDENCAIYWWGYASSMAMASPKSGYTLGQLREAIQKAMEAEKARDVSIFGINRQRGGTFENLAKLVATHFQSEPDSFILPKARLEGKAHKLSVYVGEKNICPHFHKFSMIDEEFNASLPKSTVTDISDLEEKCSADQPHEVPSLVTLSIRELHRSGCEFADGETDPNIIHYNAMVAAGSISDD